MLFLGISMQSFSDHGLQIQPVKRGKNEKRVVPDSFKQQLGKIMDQIAGLHEAELRDLAVHPVANPVLQVRGFIG